MLFRGRSAGEPRGGSPRARRTRSPQGRSAIQVTSELKKEAQLLLYDALIVQDPAADFIYAVIFLARQARDDRATLRPRRDVNWLPASHEIAQHGRTGRLAIHVPSCLFQSPLRIQAIRSRLAVVVFRFRAKSNLESLRRKRRRDVGPSHCAEHLISIERVRYGLNATHLSPVGGALYWAQRWKGYDVGKWAGPQRPCREPGKSGGMRRAV
jgi:hypothetical protein